MKTNQSMDDEETKYNSPSCKFMWEFISCPLSVTDQGNVVLELFDVPEDEVGEVDFGNLDVGVGRPHDELLLLRRDLRHLVLAAGRDGGAHEPGGSRQSIFT